MRNRLIALLVLFTVVIFSSARVVMLETTETTGVKQD